MFIDVDLDLDLNTATQADSMPLCGFMGNDWSYNSFDAFPDLMGDPNFMDIVLAAQDDLPSLDVNFSHIPKYPDKMTDPPNEYVTRSMLDTHFTRSLSPLETSIPLPSLRTVAQQTPKLPVGSGNSDNTHRLSVNECIRRLSELSISLFEYSTTIPPLAIHDPVPQTDDYQATMDSRAKDYSNYTADETFRVTQELIDIYPLFIELFTRRKVFHSSKSSHVPMSPQQPVESEQGVEYLGPVAPPLSNPLHLDHSAILLVLSCHLRLIDIYEQLFKHMKVCIDLKGVGHTQQQGTFTAPRLRIGNYVPPMTTAVTMQMLLLVHFATSLCDFAVALDGHIRKPEDGGTSAGNSPSDQSHHEVKALTLVSAERVKERATGMLQHLHSLRGMMLRDGHVV